MKEKNDQKISGFVTFLCNSPDIPEKTDVPVGPKELERTLLDLAVRNKIPLSHSCGGGGSCGTCRVIVREGLERLEARGEVEAAMAEDRGFSAEERLACQISPVVGLVVNVPPASSESETEAD